MATATPKERVEKFRETIQKAAKKYHCRMEAKVLVAETGSKSYIELTPLPVTKKTSRKK